MPELPEVETVRRGLLSSLEGHVVTHVLARRPDLRFPLPEHFRERLEGARVLHLRRRAKYMLAELSTGETLVMHLGMTGRFEVEDITGSINAPGAFALKAPEGQKHAHVLFDTDAGRRLTYFDARRFGFMGLVRTDRLDEHPWFRGMGPEPLGPEFTAAALAEALKGRSQAIKTLLLDQRIVAGLGNIYVCEALHRAAISPLRPGGKVSRPKLAALVEAVRTVLEEAIEAGGSTLRDFQAADGSLGYFQHRFQAYGREDEPCLRPGCRGVIRRKVQGGRSTFYCPEHQT
ncbi:MAG: bifunctional DNA-formamidopyrimidine glycosylase/DNA-(apurinic or apyrimidinic site) lyase [Caulobacteraceae bacterium]